ncbi:hypothetical protein [Pelistega ratti]|uniref:hypothetical protein n=1 Tax=Pelistega ratti TaxID=2652177 RepID=UPI001359D1A3|nr:hypothetical protein [Pelistega ratti]
MNNEYYSDVVEYDQNYLGRIGGNIPESLISMVSTEYYFYATLPYPNKERIMFSIFTPKNFEVMNDKNIYPDCSIKVITHVFSPESLEPLFNNPDLTRMSITSYSTLESNYYSVREENQKNFDFGDDFEELDEPYHSIVIGRKPMLIQEDDIYTYALNKDDYTFFMQIDESGMPSDLFRKNYIFGYGALYLYMNPKKEIIAGFWQN